MNARVPKMQDPFGSMQNMMSRFQRFMQNPMQFLSQNKLNVPQQYANDPNEAIQYMMNNGMVTQDQFNWAQNMAKQIQNNPQFMQMFGGRR